ncbi:MULTISPECIES: hypothetical protein [unclassified Pseudofrankia]|uniref:hypothetical protein n=1 Tax=unclassified Pseudofrankia TaxID=2994372 RepID=UPI0008D97437|nr:MULTISPECIES: hypothetical protein [unclassified Pseudofrankia]MDT3446471.1 hypothetical protein [Pseudofrankia sp. BMG5.37]OHV45176.1 hypothetical protein BCD48_23760 [Pseudofrankia sp. BMG5.36]
MRKRHAWRGPSTRPASRRTRLARHLAGKPARHRAFLAAAGRSPGPAPRPSLLPLLALFPVLGRVAGRDAGWVLVRRVTVRRSRHGSTLGY